MKFYFQKNELNLPILYNIYIIFIGPYVVINDSKNVMPLYRQWQWSHNGAFCILSEYQNIFCMVR